MPNRLSRETSPYLQQHASNPVEWYPWGEEALARAREEDKPILLSVGYSACHWCHVMAHESFEDPAVAAVMNRLFVNVKVDREERPDLDQILPERAPDARAARRRLAAHDVSRARRHAVLRRHLLSRTPRYGMPAFPDLCERIAALWREKRAEIEAQNSEVVKALARTVPQDAATDTEFSAAVLRATLDHLRANFDAEHGGFGGAPKFPHPTDLELCLRKGEAGITELTLRRMCEGGIYDQLGGGFCRYSTDAHWTIPHFEKMLYDNGPLLALLADTWLATGDALFARCAAQTAGWILREMQSPEAATTPRSTPTASTRRGSSTCGRGKKLPP